MNNIVKSKDLLIAEAELAKHAAELIIANVQKGKREVELVLANVEKAKRATELVIANEEKAMRAEELVHANVQKGRREEELVIANIEKSNRAADLVVANEEKAKRAEELIHANIEKAKRAAELIIANLEKAKRAAEIVTINKELIRASEKVKLTEELIILNKELKYQIEERKQVEAELIKAKERAEESDRLKSAFLSNMSHEMRTPMNGILGFANLLKKQNLSNDDKDRYIDIIGESGERMLNTINSIMDISRIESGLVKTNIDGANINEKLEFVSNFLKPEAEQKGLKLFYKSTLSSEEAFIMTDNEKIYGILTNLVKNAIKFTKKGSIEFGYQKKGEHLEFYVKDTGIGIPKDRCDAIFERFMKADIEDKSAYQGSGLGLAISKSYVEMLGGKIWVESEEGQGSIFYFTIPYNPVSTELKM